jgi:polyhydroxyalkanoate synthesis regulator phasin
MISLGAERPKSKLRDIEFGISRLGRVMYGLGKSHYSYQKMFRLAQPNNDLSEITVNLYDDVSGTLMDIAKDKYNVNQHDITIAPGSTLPTSKWAEYNVYLEAFQLGIVDREEVLKKNPEIFDKEGILQRTGEIQQLQGMVQQLESQVKDLQGDLQTARRESVADRKRVEVEKFKSKLSNVESDAKATNKVQAEKLAGAVKLAAEKSKNMMGSTLEAGETL